MSEWKPGDVVALHIDNDCYVGRDEIVRLMEELIRWWRSRPRREVGISGGTAHLRFIARAFHDAQFGRLVVIDPEDREQVERMAVAYANERGLILPDSSLSDALQAALREFANPTPPRPDEPTGKWAVVTAFGVTYVRAAWASEKPWSRVGTDRFDSWAEMDVESIEFEGVQP